MRISSRFNIVSHYKNFSIKPLKNQKVIKIKETFNKLDNKAGFLSIPAKYYLIGLATPIPFASAAGFVIGIGVAAYKKIREKIRKDNPS